MSTSCSPSVPSTVAPYTLTERSPSNRRRKRRSGGDRAALTDPALRHWLDSFHGFHAESETYRVAALRLDADSPEESRGTASRHALPGSAARYVYEVALRRDARGEQWVLLCWEVDVPGIQFCECADRSEAMALFAEPARAAGRWHGVRLRPEARSW